MSRMLRMVPDRRSSRIQALAEFATHRFARSTRHLILALEEFQSLGVDFVSLNESIDTSSPMGRMVFTVLAAVAELERNIIRERVHMGIVRARKEGKRLGRPMRIFDRDKARTMLQNMSIREVARQLGVSRGVVRAVKSRPSTTATD
jgi:DNA invertase Pin-like site-specific DNA recombinase